MPTLWAVSGSMTRMVGARYSKSLNCAALLCVSSRRKAYAPADAAAVPMRAANLGRPEDWLVALASAAWEASPRRNGATTRADARCVRPAARARAPLRASTAVGDITRGGPCEGDCVLICRWFELNFLVAKTFLQKSTTAT